MTTAYDFAAHPFFPDWPDLLHALLSDDSEKHVWRGVANAGWCMTTSLDRFADDHQKSDRSGLSGTLLDLYSTHLVESGLEELPDEERLWALGQHYGLPTPFLDWSRSPAVAAFFALTSEDPIEARATRMSAIYRLDVSDRDALRGDISLVELGQGIWNQRLRAQRGLFTHLKQGECMLDLLIRNKKRKLVQAYVFPAALRDEALATLDSMLIDDLRMFPDHEGVVRHVRALAAR